MINALCRDPHGQFSASKFWTNVAYATATYVVIANANSTNWELLLVYVATVGGSEVAKKFLNMRYGGSNSGTNSTDSTEYTRREPSLHHDK
jgi:hypothetical protein